MLNIQNSIHINKKINYVCMTLMNTPARKNIKHYLLLLCYIWIIPFLSISFSRVNFGRSENISSHSLSIRIHKRRNDYFSTNQADESETSPCGGYALAENFTFNFRSRINKFFVKKILFAKKTALNITDTFFTPISGPPIYLRLCSLTI